MWEVATKRSLGRDDFRADPGVLRRGLLENGYLEVPVSGEHAVQVGVLPSLHKDPFDHILLAQAVIEGMLLVTVDMQVAAYPGPVRKV